MATAEMDADDEILRKLAAGVAIDYSIWPVVLADIVARIEKIAHTSFPIPRIPPPKQASPLPEPRLLDPLPSSDPIDPPIDDASSHTEVGKPDGSQHSSSSQETNKENTNPVPPPAPAPAPQPAEPADPNALPPQVVSLMNDITTTLTASFPLYPPHTTQRLAELVLAPRQHYRSLPSYLHALDRVVHVTSGSNAFPLPPAVPDMSAMTLLSNGPAREGAAGTTTTFVNGTSIASASTGLHVGSDEALGGALLTPIPWLQRRAASSSAGSSSPPDPDPVQLAQQTPSAPQQQQPQPQQQSSSSTAPLEGQVHTETTETIEGPNGMGSVETVSISVNGVPSHGASGTPLQVQQQQQQQQQLQRGVTQGELLRQEQRAGVVPVTQLARASMPATAGPLGLSAAPPSSSSSPNSNTNPAGAHPTVETEEDTAMPDQGADNEPPSTDAKPSQRSAPAKDDAPPPSTSSEEAGGGGEEEEEDEVPHARGPEAIGAADTGPQSASSSSFSVGSTGAIEMRGIDVAAAVGRNKDDDTAASPPPGRGGRSTTPKREVGDVEGAEADVPAAKRVKENEGAGEGGTGPEEKKGEEEVKKDAEGDTVVTDEKE